MTQSIQHYDSLLEAHKKRVNVILTRLKKMYPKAGMVLRYSNNWELLVAVMLSAQCTDKQVNIVTARLFKKYRKLDDYVQVRQSAFEKDIYSTGFYRMKAKHILAAAKMIKKDFRGRVPRRMEDLLKLSGVARKTANIVLGNAFGIVQGIAVDTHVARMARIFHLTRHVNPDKIEKDLMEVISKKDWFRSTYLFIEYGRSYPRLREHRRIDHPLKYLE
ncbi:MAG: endonuclease III [Candidatus Harrisonbacteria bacterium CG10_big_fil_rev_8_21_14_0_10_42_17]|uniref:Endonuclease III n=1 Tax=Candidatus Harrisonbacteria bacterium CG10_big_fil_rev_8_21_14_0_10_42_17 TaxID=1974584 RepID=A0A2M6WHT6_9BACT|nr:MAG: endonuclease III [Candidatus Harrisonbacteria bacterium CG10_big_fil_rev_8_21_14_0_10_42_17]